MVRFSFRFILLYSLKVECLSMLTPILSRKKGQRWKFELRRIGLFRSFFSERTNNYWWFANLLKSLQQCCKMGSVVYFSTIFIFDWHFMTWFGEQVLQILLLYESCNCILKCTKIRANPIKPFHNWNPLRGENAAGRTSIILTVFSIGVITPQAGVKLGS